MTPNSTSETATFPAPDAPASGSRTSLPELLAPAGDWDCARAAVENGADAIYFGLDRFNARMRARNFTVGDLPLLMKYLRRRGVKGYVTFNTLVFEDELAAAEETLRSIIAAGVDAVLVQDIGLCRLIRQLSPDFPIHASTQMTITSAAGVEFARALGCHLVVLARECSIAEIKTIRESLAGSASAAALPLEVFVHGALCVAYSGQCLTSEALGGRSANRGECAQACRMPYELFADGKPVPLGDRRYLLSPQDLAGLEVLPRLIAAGVSSLKIEGRLKSPEYVANITRVYRQALDALFDGREAECGGNRSARLDAGPYRYDMEMAFSRGLHTGWLEGINNQALVHARFGKKRGVYLGRVTRVQEPRVFARLECALKPGDGVVFDAGHPDQTEEGGRVYTVEPAAHASRPALRIDEGAPPAEYVLTFGRGELNLARIHPGDRLWKTSDPELDRRLRQSFTGDTPRFQRSVRIKVTGAVEEPLRVEAWDEFGHYAVAQSEMALVAAEKRPLDETGLREQLGRLGGTAYRLDALDNRLGSGLILPVSELNRMRRALVRELDEQRDRPRRWTVSSSSPPRQEPALAPASNRSRLATPSLIVLVRKLNQLEAALGEGARILYCELENPKHYRDAVRMVRGSPPVHATSGGPEIFVAPPRIFKSGEEWILKLVRACEPDGFLARNYDHLRWFEGARRIGDFSLNVANHWSAVYLMERHGLERLTASYDLNSDQLEALLKGAPAAWFEVTIHQHMPMFHMEHCVFCAFLSQGTDYTNCGRPCDRLDVRLRDRVGAMHVLKADAGCRNTLYNARAQTGAEYVGGLLALGLRHFRIEFVDESPIEVAETMALYRDLIEGRMKGTELWRRLKLHRQLGVTRGPMEPRSG